MQRTAHCPSPASVQLTCLSCCTCRPPVALLSCSPCRLSCAACSWSWLTAAHSWRPRTTRWLRQVLRRPTCTRYGRADVGCRGLHLLPSPDNTVALQRCASVSRCCACTSLAKPLIWLAMSAVHPCCCRRWLRLIVRVTSWPASWMHHARRRRSWQRRLQQHAVRQTRLQGEQAGLSVAALFCMRACLLAAAV